MNTEIDISNIVLNTERILLRPWRQEDLNDLFEYAKVDGVGQMAGWMPHKDFNESQTILNMFINSKSNFAIVYNDKVIGSIGIDEYDENDLPNYTNKKGRELGFVLSKDYWGLGIMKEAVGEVIKYLFEIVKLDFIVCGHFVDNNQSKRVQEKLGFKQITMRKLNTRYGIVKDSIVSVIEKLDVDEDITLVPYYPSYNTTLTWYQDIELVKQVDNKDEPYDLNLLKQMYDYLTINGYCYYINYQGQIVGDATLKYDGELAIVISKPYQNKHIGRRCINRLIEFAKIKNINKLFVNIYSFNTQSKKMFESLGFLQTGNEHFEYIIKK